MCCRLRLHLCGRCAHFRSQGSRQSSSCGRQSRSYTGAWSRVRRGAGLPTELVEAHGSGGKAADESGGTAFVGAAHAGGAAATQPTYGSPSECTAAPAVHGFATHKLLPSLHVHLALCRSSLQLSQEWAGSDQSIKLPGPKKSWLRSMLLDVPLVFLPLHR